MSLDHIFRFPRRTQKPYLERVMVISWAYITINLRALQALGLLAWALPIVRIRLLLSRCHIVVYQGHCQNPI